VRCAPLWRRVAGATRGGAVGPEADRTAGPGRLLNIIRDIAGIMSNLGPNASDPGAPGYRRRRLRLLLPPACVTFRALAGSRPALTRRQGWAADAEPAKGRSSVFYCGVAPLAALLAMLLASGTALAWGIVVTLNQPPVIGGTPPAS